MKKFKLISILLIVGFCTLFAQKKAVSEAKSAATQDKPDYKTAESLIKEALINDETKNDVKTWYTAGFIFNKKFEDERNKKLIKLSFDEPGMYRSLLEGFNYWFKCIEIDKLPNEKGKVKPKYESELRDKIKENVNELINGGAYFYDQKDYKSAYKLFNFYNQASVNPNLKGLGIGEDPNLQMIPYYACLSALKMENDSVSISALEFAKTKNYERYLVYNFLTSIYHKTNQNDKYNETLKEGYAFFPDSIYFAGNLINSYINTKDFENASKFLLESIKRKPNDNLYIALGEVYQESGKPEELAKSAFEEAIKLNPSNHTAYFYIGRMSFNKAVELSNKAYETKDKKKQAGLLEKTKGFYREALPSFQKALELSPNSIEYMNPLRSIYYNLNMMKDFDVLDKKISAFQKK